jgi:hypothetical protein
LDRVQGTVHFNDDALQLAGFVGENAGGQITCNGTWTNLAPDSELRLVFEGRSIRLEDELRDALSPGAKRVWNELQPQGALHEVTVSYVKPSRFAPPVVEVWLSQPRGRSPVSTALSLKPRGFPYRLDDVTGRVHYVDSTVEFGNFRATHGATTVLGEGTGRVHSADDWQLQFSRLVVDALAIDRDLYQAVPVRLREGLQVLAPTGPVNIDGRLTIQADGRGLNTSWNAGVTVVDGALQSVLPLQGVTGQFNMEGSASAQQFSSRGELLIDSLFHRGIQLTQVRGPFWLDGQRLILGTGPTTTRQGQPHQPIKSRVFGGSLEGDAVVRFQNGGNFDLRARLAEADLASVVQAMSRRPPRVSGKAHGTMELAGNSGGTNTFQGRGRIGVREANIYELPFIFSLLSVLRAEPTESTGFEACDIDFEVLGDQIYCERIDLTGDAMSLKGRGYVNLQRQVNLDFYSLVGRDSDYLPVVLPFLREASRQLLQIKVSGTLDNPRTSQQVLPELNGTLRQWMSDNDPGRARKK